MDDFIVEPAVETFDGVLTLATPTANVDILPAVASVEIVDNDSKYLIEVVGVCVYVCVCVCVCICVIHVYDVYCEHGVNM